MSSICLSFDEVHEQAAKLDIRVSVTGFMSVIDLLGDVDKYTCPRLRQTILDLLGDGIRQIVVSLENVEYIDSTGLGSLVSGMMSVSRQNGQFAVFGANPRIRKALEITGLSRLIPVFDSESAALDSFAFEEALALAA